MRFRLLTVLWGSAFVDRFLNIALKSLLAAGNLPALAARGPVTFALYTTAADEARLRAHPLVVRAAELVELRTVTFSLREIDPANPYSHWTLWQRGFSEARGADEWLITVAADHLFSNGTMARWAELFAAGYLAIFSPGVQVALETVEEEMNARFGGEEAIDLTLEQTRDVMFRHLHPVNVSMFRDSPRWMTHPEYHLRPLSGGGFTQNILTSHAVAFHATKIQMTDNFCPIDNLDRVAFEPCRFLSVEPLLKNLASFFRPWQMDGDALTHFGAWAWEHITPVNVRECKVTHVYRPSSAAPSVDARRATLGADFYVGQMLASRRIFRLWRELHRQGLGHAGTWLAVAHVHARLRRHLPVPPDATVFIPRESFLARIDEREAERFLAGRGKALIDACRAHVVAQRIELTPGECLTEDAAGPIRTLVGRRYKTGTTGPIRILRGPMWVDGLAVYVIDAALVSLRLEPLTGRRAVALLRRRLRHAAGQAMRSARKALMAVLRRHRHAYVLARGVYDRLLRARSSARGLPGTGIADRQGTIFRRALAERALLALRELYALYERQALRGSGVVSVVGERLGDCGPVTDGLRSLRSAVVAAPGVADAWLELGYARLGAGDEPGAVDAFQTAATLTPSVAPARGEADPRVLAAVELAGLRTRRGEFADALAALDAVKTLPPIPWRGHLLRARLLLRLGRRREATAAFEASLERDQITPRLADLPRKFSMLQQCLRAERAERATSDALE